MGIMEHVAYVTEQKASHKIHQKWIIQLSDLLENEDHVGILGMMKEGLKCFNYRLVCRGHKLWFLSYRNLNIPLKSF